MNDKRKIRIGVTDIALLALCAVLLIGTLTFLTPCGPKEDGSWMTCHWAGQMSVALAAVLFTMAVMHAAVPMGGAKLGIDLAVLPAAVLASQVPGHVIGLCMMETMRCRAVMRPGVAVLSVLIAAAAAWDLVLRLKAGKTHEV